MRTAMRMTRAFEGAGEMQTSMCSVAGARSAASPDASATRSVQRRSSHFAQFRRAARPAPSPPRMAADPQTPPRPPRRRPRPARTFPAARRSTRAPRRACRRADPHSMLCIRRFRRSRARARPDSASRGGRRPRSDGPCRRARSTARPTSAPRPDQIPARCRRRRGAIASMSTPARTAAIQSCPPLTPMRTSAPRRGRVRGGFHHPTQLSGSRPRS